MTRREFVSTAAAAVLSNPSASLTIPVHRVMDSRSRCTLQQVSHFSSSIWPEAVRDFQRCGIEFQVSQVTGEVRRSPGGRPVFIGLEHRAINLVITDHILQNWDQGKGVTGVSTRYDGYDISMVALDYAHGHQIPFLAVNTCVHELLHVLLLDIFDLHPKGLAGYEREFRIDWYATRLWLFRDGAAIRKSAQVYLDRLRSTADASVTLDLFEQA
jgi:hypothetical protein